MAMLSHHDLIQACKKGDVPSTRHFLQNIDPSTNDNEAVIEASRNGHIDVVKLLLADPRVDPRAMGNEPIILASDEGHTDVVDVLLADPRVDPRARLNAAIRIASRKGHTELVQHLLNDPRVDPSARKNEAIIDASASGHTDVVKLLLADPRVDPSADDNAAIRFASYVGHREIVKLHMAHPKVSPNIEIVRQNLENSNWKIEFFQAATNPEGLKDLLPLANLVDRITLELLDIFLSRAKGIQLNQEFLHSLRLLRLPIPAKIKLVYGKHLQALVGVHSWIDVLTLVGITVYLADMGIHADLFRIIAQYL